jgi:sterol 3beta-glucosyltransferase
MKISLLTLGTRGDVQPYAILGKALQNRGHEVVLSTGKNFEGLANEYGLKFRAVEADFQALINSEEGKAMMKNPFLARKHFTSIVQPMMVDAMKTFYEVSKESDCVLYHVKSLADFFADQFPEKMMRANVIPAIQPTREFPNPVFSALPLPKILNRFTYKLADLGLAMMNKTIREFRIAAGLGAKFPKKLDLPSIYCVSPRFLPKPNDFPSNSYFTGFWQGESSQALDADVVEFLSSGSWNLLVTFGSMPFETKFDLQKSI